jgi:tetratricopeptide (TPR) repeat protein
MENENYADAQVLLNSAQDLSQNNRARLSEINALNTEIELRKTLQRGTILFQLGEFEDASKVFNEILASNPDNKVAKEYYDKCRIELTQTDQEMDPETKKRYLKGVDAFVKGHYQKAITIWDSILIEQPYNKRVRKALDDAKERASIDKK